MKENIASAHDMVKDFVVDEHDQTFSPEVTADVVEEQGLPPPPFRRRATYDQGASQFSKFPDKILDRSKQAHTCMGKSKQIYLLIRIIMIICPST